MIELLRKWLEALMVLSLLLAVVESLVPDGSLRKVASMIGGLLLISVLLQPVVRGRLVPQSTQEEIQSISERTAELEQERNRRWGELIAARTAAYIENKALELGIEDCQAQVSVAEENGIPVPYEVTLRCRNAPPDRLRQDIKEHLGIQEERQVYQYAEVQTGTVEKAVDKRKVGPAGAGSGDSSAASAGSAENEADRSGSSGGDDGGSGCSGDTDAGTVVLH